MEITFKQFTKKMKSRQALTDNEEH